MDPLKSGAIFKIKNIGILRGAQSHGSNGKSGSVSGQGNGESLKNGSSPEKGSHGEGAGSTSLEGPTDTLIRERFEDIYRATPVPQVALMKSGGPHVGTAQSMVGGPWGPRPLLAQHTAPSVAHKQHMGAIGQRIPIYAPVPGMPGSNPLGASASYAAHFPVPKGSPGEMSGESSRKLAMSWPPQHAHSLTTASYVEGDSEKLDREGDRGRSSASSSSGSSRSSTGDENNERRRSSGGGSRGRGVTGDSLMFLEQLPKSPIKKKSCFGSERGWSETTHFLGEADR